MRRQRRRARQTVYSHPILIAGPIGSGSVVPSKREASQVRPLHRRRLFQRRRLPFALCNPLIEHILWFLVAGFLALSVWASPRTQPRRLIMHGVPPAARAQIEGHLRQLWQRAPYSLRIGARTLENEVKRFGWVAEARVHPLLPAQLHLHIQPREAFVEIQSASGGRIFIDPAGIVFQPPNPPERTPGGVIFLSGSTTLPSEGTLQKGVPLWRAFELLRALHQRDRTAQYVRTVQIEPNGELNLSCQVAGGTTMRFRLGDAVLYQQQVQLIQLLLNSPTVQGAQWEYVDIKSPFHPAVKPLSQGATRKRSDSFDTNKTR